MISVSSIRNILPFQNFSPDNLKKSTEIRGREIAVFRYYAMVIAPSKMKV
jgi:hypothetical protein